MSKQIGLVCGSFHREEVSRMLDFAKDEAEQHGLTIGEVVWVPGSCLLYTSPSPRDS